MKIVVSKADPVRKPTSSSVGVARTSGLLRFLLRVSVLLVAFALGASAAYLGQAREMRSAARGAVRNVVGSLRAEAVEFGIVRSNNLPTLYVDMAFEDYQAILDKRAEALRVGILLSTDDDFVPARVRLEDQDEVPVEMRLKGDWTDQFWGDKWAYRIHVLDGQQVGGMRRFSIQPPETRNFLNEWAFHQNLQQEGILTTRYAFVNVVFNGQHKGIYALEESFSKELLEAQSRREGVIVRFDEDDLWYNRAEFTAEGMDVYLEAALLTGFFFNTQTYGAAVDAFQNGHIADDPALTTQAEAALDMLRALQTGDRRVSEVVDVELMGRFFALTDLWDAGHGTIWHNWRFYYNPITGKLEPVAYDAEPLVQGGRAYPSAATLDFLRDPLIQEAYSRELYRITQPEYLAALEDTLEDEFVTFQRALKGDYRKEELTPPWERLEQRRRVFQAQLSPTRAVRGSFQWSNATGNEQDVAYLQASIVNLMALPVEVVGFQIGGELVTPEPDWVTPETRVHLASELRPNTLLPFDSPRVQEERGELVFEPVRFNIPLEASSQVGATDPDALQVGVVVRLAGLTETHTIPLSEGRVSQPLMSGPAPALPDVDEVLSQHPFLVGPGPGRVMSVKTGEWDVEGDLILPEGVGLAIPPGASLRFEEGAILLNMGPVTIMGTDENPVTLTAQRDSWGGVVVLEAGGESVWKNAIIEKTGGVERGAWMLTGGITFFESPVKLDQVRILHSQAEDAINVVHSAYVFHASEFGHSASDAFDGDFTQGQISDSSFHDIGGDAIDVSGSSLGLSNTSIVDVRDKALSAGEQSDVEARDLRIERVGIGVASKDQSVVLLEQVTISDAVHAALAAFIKKLEYGPATIEASHLSIQNTETRGMVQTDSVVRVNGEPLDTTDLDVDALYAQGILGN